MLLVIIAQEENTCVITQHKITAIMGRWTGLSSFIDFHFENGHHHHHSHQKSFRSRMRLSTRYHKLDDSIFVFCRNCGNSVKVNCLLFFKLRYDYHKFSSVNVQSPSVKCMAIWHLNVGKIKLGHGSRLADTAWWLGLCIM